MKTEPDIDPQSVESAAGCTGLIVIAFAALCLVAIGFGLGLAAAGVTC